MPAGFDIIGDVHGRAGALARLLAKLGYDDWGHHPEGRQALFVGDLNDKGPDSQAVTDRVEAWVGAGRARAILGNHELNAVAWNTPGEDGKPLRRHSAAHRKQHAAQLAERARNPWAYSRAIAFYRTLPLWLDLGELRLIHACWDADAVAVLERRIGAGEPVRKKALRKMFTPGHALHAAVETAAKGPEIALPKLLHYRDAQGALRTKGREKWWMPPDAPLRDVVLASGGRDLPRAARSKKMKRPPGVRTLYRDPVPVFFGHYHLKRKPFVTAPNAACVDFGAGSGRWLAAYRFSGKPLRDADFVKVRANA